MTDTYLVTGANRGIGLEMARGVLAAGDRLIAVCRTPSMSEALVTLAAAHADRFQMRVADVCDPDALAAVAREIDGSVDVVVCNAGAMSARGGVADDGNTAVSIAQVMMTNMAGPFFTARAFLGALDRSERPRIAIISSVMGSQQHTGSGAYFYRASKAGANNLMVTLANELQPRGVAVAAYHPGWVQTDMGGPSADLTPAQSATALLARFRTLDLSQTGRFMNYDGTPLPL